MSNHSLLDDDSFWQILCHLEQLKAPRPVSEICEALKVSEQKLIKVLYFLHGLNVQFTIENSDEGAFIVPPTETSIIQFNFTLSEWLSFQSHFPAIDLYKKGKSHDTLIRKLSDIEKKYDKHDLYMAEDFVMPTIDQACLDMDDESFEAGVEDKLKIIELAIVRKNLIHLKLKCGNTLLLYPHRIVNIEGGLSVVGEDSQDSCVTYIKVIEIEDLNINSIDDYMPRYSGVEINQFIRGLREISDSEIRLILKIYDRELSLDPHYEFIGRPYVTINSMGERIWAATVEPSDALFNWISGFGTKVEILEPVSFKKQYLQYLENDLKKAG